MLWLAQDTHLYFRARNHNLLLIHAEKTTHSRLDGKNNTHKNNKNSTQYAQLVL